MEQEIIELLIKIIGTALLVGTFIGYMFAFFARK